MDEPETKLFKKDALSEISEELKYTQVNLITYRLFNEYQF